MSQSLRRCRIPCRTWSKIGSPYFCRFSYTLEKALCAACQGSVEKNKKNVLTAKLTKGEQITKGVFQMEQNNTIKTGLYLKAKGTEKNIYQIIRTQRKNVIVKSLLTGLEYTIEKVKLFLLVNPIGYTLTVN
jgi:hypothetical protein